MSYACVPGDMLQCAASGHFVAVPDQEPLLQHTGMLPLLQQDGRQNWQFNYAGRLEQLRLAASVRFSRDQVFVVKSDMPRN